MQSTNRRFLAGLPFLVSVVTGLTLSCARLPSAQAQTLTLSSTRAQKIKGWGFTVSTNQTGNYSSILAADNPAMAQLAYKSGVNVVRLEVPSTATNSSGQLDAPTMTSVKRDIQNAKDNGVTRYLLSTWSPPAYMKLPVQSVLGQVGSNEAEYLDPARVNDFAEHWVKIVQDIQSAGFRYRKVSLFRTNLMLQIRVTTVASTTL